MTKVLVVWGERLKSAVAISHPMELLRAEIFYLELNNQV
jgi:hypothetical protein